MRSVFAILVAAAVVSVAVAEGKSPAVTAYEVAADVLNIPVSTIATPALSPTENAGSDSYYSGPSHGTLNSTHVPGNSSNFSASAATSQPPLSTGAAAAAFSPAAGLVVAVVLAGLVGVGAF